MRRAAVSLAVFTTVVTCSLAANAAESVGSEDRANERAPSLLVMATADLKYGLVRVQGVTDEDMFDSEKSETHGLGRAGVGAFVGGMPSRESKFTLGAQLRAETLFAEEWIAPILGGAALVGVTIGEPQGRQFGFVLAGVGADGVPALTPAISTAHLLGGTCVDGLVLAAGVDLGVLEDVSYYLFGIEIGWGRFV